MKKNLLLILLIFSISLISAQNKNLSSLVSFSESTPFNTAVEIFNNYTQEYENRQLINLSSYNGPISIEIDKIHWRLALKNILIANNLELQPKDNFLIVKNMPQVMEEKSPDASEEEAAKAIFFSDKNKEVMVNLTFFIANSEVLSEIGIDWNTIFNGEVSFNVDYKGNQVTEKILSLEGNHEFESGQNTVKLDVLFDTFSSNGLGHIISQPKITVKNGEEGFVQDGEDFSIKSVDQSGNTVEKFFSSGTIVKVTPEIHIDDKGNEYVYLAIEAERSSVSPSATSTIVKKSQVKTSKSLYDGEKAFVGGLSVKEESETRIGIPILKDLPWWVFGIRYLAGYEKKQVTNKELLIFVETIVLDNIKQRAKDRENYKKQVDKIRKKLPSTEKELVPTEK